MADTEFMEQHIRDKTLAVARVMRDYADRIELTSRHHDVTYIPAALVQDVTNMIANLRYDLPVMWLGELMKAERSISAQETKNPVVGGLLEGNQK